MSRIVPPVDENGYSTFTGEYIGKVMDPLPSVADFVGFFDPPDDYLDQIENIERSET